MPKICGPPWLRAILAALMLVVGFALPDYSLALEHSPTYWVEPALVGSVEPIGEPTPLAIVLARERTNLESLVKVYLSSTSDDIGDRQRERETGSTNPLKRWLVC